MPAFCSVLSYFSLTRLTHPYMMPVTSVAEKCFALYGMMWKVKLNHQCWQDQTLDLFFYVGNLKLLGR